MFELSSTGKNCTIHDDHDRLLLLGRGWSENHVYTLMYAVSLICPSAVRFGQVSVDGCCIADVQLGIPGSYFELPEDSLGEDESHEDTRHAELLEVCIPHVTFQFMVGKKAWRPEDKSVFYLCGPTWPVPDARPRRWSRYLKALWNGCQDNRFVYRGPLKECYVLEVY
jgi:hypothetical protein